MAISQALLEALDASHQRLAGTLASVDDPAGSAYPDEWSVAQVASHLGSGAEIFTLLLEAGLTGGDAPGPDQMQPVWAVWNAKTPDEQVRDVLTVDASFIDRVRALSDEEQSRWRLEFFGSERDLAGLLRMRLSEHLMHTWDIAVTLDPAATIDGTAGAMTLDNTPVVVARTGKPTTDPLAVDVETTDPDGRFRLDLTPDGAQLTPAPDDATSTGTGTSLRLPTEAFLRLVYGRLDADHTPSDVTAVGIDLDTLRHTFPGV